MKRQTLILSAESLMALLDACRSDREQRQKIDELCEHLDRGSRHRLEAIHSPWNVDALGNLLYVRVVGKIRTTNSRTPRVEVFLVSAELWKELEEKNERIDPGSEEELMSSLRRIIRASEERIVMETPDDTPWE